MKKVKQKYCFPTLERQAIAVAIASDIERGLPALSASRLHGISRMTLWNWVSEMEEVRIIINGAIARRKDELEKQRKQKILDSKPSASRPEGWQLIARSVITKEAHKNTEKPIVCQRCGHSWRPRSYPVRKCAHPSCQSLFFTSSARYSDAEKKAATRNRLEYKPTPAVKDGLLPRKRGRPARSAEGTPCA